MLVFPGFGGPDRSFWPDVRRDIRPKLPLWAEISFLSGKDIFDFVRELAVKYFRIVPVRDSTQQNKA